MQFHEFLKQSANEIDLEIEKFLKVWNKETEQLSPRLVPLLKGLKDAAVGGKRIRGTLVILGYTLVSKTPNPELLKVAAAYELFQTAILAHDDIIDKSSTRRGKSSLHEVLGGGHYGNAQAICLGDIGFFLAYKLIAESSFDDAQKVKAISFFSNSIIQTTVGEMMDVELSFAAATASQKEILAVARLKTAYYTFVAPLTLGAILAGADDTLLKKLALYGENIGIAFQLQDDIHDIFGTETLLKKKVGGDIKEGKQTMLFKKAKELANTKEAVLLETSYGKSTIDAQDIENIKNVFSDTGALAYTQKLSHDYSDKARAVIPAVTDDAHLQTLLGEIIDYVI